MRLDDAPDDPSDLLDYVLKRTTMLSGITGEVVVYVLTKTSIEVFRNVIDTDDSGPCLKILQHWDGGVQTTTCIPHALIDRYIGITRKTR